MVRWPVPEHALAVDPGGVVCENAKRGLDLGAAVMAVHAQGNGQGPGKGWRWARAASSSSRWRSSWRQGPVAQSSGSASAKGRQRLPVP